MTRLAAIILALTIAAPAQAGIKWPFSLPFGGKSASECSENCTIIYKQKYKAPSVCIVERQELNTLWQNSLKSRKVVYLRWSSFFREKSKAKPIIQKPVKAKAKSICHRGEKQWYWNAKKGKRMYRIRRTC